MIECAFLWLKRASTEETQNSSVSMMESRRVGSISFKVTLSFIPLSYSFCLLFVNKVVLIFIRGYPPRKKRTKTKKVCCSFWIILFSLLISLLPVKSTHSFIHIFMLLNDEVKDCVSSEGIDVHIVLHQCQTH